MAIIIHNIDVPDSGLGDALRTGFNNQNTMNAELYNSVVFKVSGYDLSKNDFTDLLLAKLNALDATANKNVQPDWNELDPTSDAYIKNKPVFSSDEIFVGAEWTGTGLEFDVYADAFPIGGEVYPATPSLVTLDASDATLDRIDLIVAIKPTSPDTVGTVGKITGTPASSSLVVPPDYDPSLYYVIKQITVKAAATTPNGAENTVIFNEGTEWALTLPASAAVNTSSPSTGANCIEATSWGVNDKIVFTSPTALSTSDLDLLKFDIKLKDLQIKKYIGVTIINGTHRLATRYFTGGSNGFDYQNLSYQTISLTKAFLNLNVENFTAIEIVYFANTAGFYFDNFKILKGSGSEVTPNTGIPDVPNDNILYGRKNGAWEGIPEATGDMSKAVYDPDSIEDDVFAIENMKEAVSSIATPDDADTVSVFDSTAGVFVRVLWSNVKATLKTYFDTLYVALTGNQTIGGVKTFSNSPIIPAPTTDFQAATKKYVDDNAGGGGGGSAPIAITYASNAAMIADQASQILNYIYYDTNYYWRYLGTTTGDITDYDKVSDVFLDKENVFSENQNVKKFAGKLIVGEQVNNNARKFEFEEDPTNTATSNPRNFNINAYPSEAYTGWRTKINFILKQLADGDINIMSLQESMVTINTSLTVNGTFSQSKVDLSRNSNVVMDLNSYDGNEGMITATKVGSVHTLNDYFKGGSGGGWTIYRKITIASGNSGETLAIEIKMSSTNVLTIRLRGGVQPEKLDLTQLGSYADDTAAAAGGVSIGYGYINSSTGALHRRLT